LKALQGFEDQATDRTGSLPRLAWVFASRVTNENNPNLMDVVGAIARSDDQ
jgi:hypothetical protein